MLPLNSLVLKYWKSLDTHAVKKLLGPIKCFVILLYIFPILTLEKEIV